MDIPLLPFLSDAGHRPSGRPEAADWHIAVATTAEQRERIFGFRYDIYVREMGKPLAAADHERCRLTDELDVDATMLLATDAAGAVLGTMRVHFAGVPTSLASRLGVHLVPPSPGPIAFVSKAMVECHRRGSRVFGALVRRAVGMALAHGIRFALLHCRESLVPLYTRVGFRRHGTSFTDPEVGQQVPMLLDLECVPEALGGHHSPRHAA